MPNHPMRCAVPAARPVATHPGCRAARRETGRQRDAWPARAGATQRTLDAAGFTILEVLAALLVLTVGLLALAATMGYAASMVGQGKRYAEVAALAQARIEMLRAGGCDAMSPGSTIAGRYAVSWTVARVHSGGARQIGLTVTSPTTRGTRADTLTATVLC